MRDMWDLLVDISRHARKLEHLGLSIHTGYNPILRPEFSNHSEKYNHSMEHENFKIIHSSQSNDK